MIKPPRLTGEVYELLQRFNAPVADVRPGVSRQRCRTCRGYLWITGKKVHAIDGLYCVLSCAPWSEAEIAALDAWFDELAQHCGCSGSKGRKIMYETEQEALERIRVPLYMRPYECPRMSGYFHLTKKAGNHVE